MGALNQKEKKKEAPKLWERSKETIPDIELRAIFYIPEHDIWGKPEGMEPNYFDEEIRPN